MEIEAINCDQQNGVGLMRALSLTTPISYEVLPAAVDFEATRLRAAILDSQRNGQHYRDFSRRAMLAGVQGYT